MVDTLIDTLIDTYIAKTYDFFRNNIIIMSTFMYRDAATMYQIFTVFHL